MTKLEIGATYVIGKRSGVQGYNTKDKKYHIWGGKGISVCADWKNDFMNFYNWANATGYSKGLQIDRINPNGNYEPDNCQWLTQKEHARKTQNDKKRGKI